MHLPELPNRATEGIVLHAQISVIGASSKPSPSQSRTATNSQTLGHSDVAPLIMGSDALIGARVTLAASRLHWLQWGHSLTEIPTIPSPLPAR